MLIPSHTKWFNIYPLRDVWLYHLETFLLPTLLEGRTTDDADQSREEEIISYSISIIGKSIHEVGGKWHKSAQISNNLSNI